MFLNLLLVDLCLEENLLIGGIGIVMLFDDMFFIIVLGVW